MIRYAATLVLFLFATQAVPQELRRVVGVNHDGGRYSFNLPWPVPAGDSTLRDYLNEGAADILAVGSTTIKIYLHPIMPAF